MENHLDKAIAQLVAALDAQYAGNGFPNTSSPICRLKIQQALKVLRQHLEKSTESIIKD